MSQYFDVDYELDSRYIRGLRAIFEKDSMFVYNKDKPNESQLVISTDYPDDADTAMKIPHIIMSSASYRDNIQNTFGYNFARDVPHKGMVNGAQQYAYVIPYNVTLTCVGEQNTSKDLASRVRWYIAFGATQYFSEKLNLQISEVTKGNTAPSKQFPKKIFDTQISISGTLYWVGTKGPENAFADIDTPLQNVKIKF